MKKLRILALLLAASLLLSGCALKTVEELYCLPKRAQIDKDLQSVIDEAMDGLEYSAPKYGENRLVVQSADLDGDGKQEYLLFARDSSEKPLKILIFCQLASGYVLMDTIEGYGFDFDFVAYQQLDDRPGVEIIVGRLVSEEVVRSVSVYRFSSGFSRQMLSTAYSRMSVADLDNDGMHELYLLTQSLSETDNGTVRMYAYRDEELQHVDELSISTKATDYKQMTVTTLSDGAAALYVTCVEKDVLVTDIFGHDESGFTCFAAGLETEMLHHSFVYPNDMDGDDILELARLIPMEPQEGIPQQYIVQWYDIDRTGAEEIKLYTYHNFLDNWYLILGDAMLHDLKIERRKDNCVFYKYDSQTDTVEPILTITALPDADREELAQMPGRVVLYVGDSVIYVADISDIAEEYGLTEITLPTLFSPIRVDLNTQED